MGQSIASNWQFKRFNTDFLDLPPSIGPPRSSSCLDSSSLKAWFLNRRPGVKPHSGLSAGRATSTSWVISANRMTCYARITIGGREDTGLKM